MKNQITIRQYEWNGHKYLKVYYKNLNNRWAAVSKSSNFKFENLSEAISYVNQNFPGCELVEVGGK